MKELSKIEKFSLYLYHIKNIKSNLRIQKILFFLRVYEVIKKVDAKKSLIFEKNDDNFEAWIYGPVNIKSYSYLSPIVMGLQQINDNDLLLLDSVDKYVKKYDHVIEYFNDEQYDTWDLVNWAHKNKAYQKARIGVPADMPCTKTLKEKDRSFVEFDQWNFPDL